MGYNGNTGHFEHFKTCMHIYVMSASFISFEATAAVKLSGQVQRRKTEIDSKTGYTLVIRRNPIKT